MRFRGLHHVELSVLDYERSVSFYDRMFGWLGYTSFWTLDIGYRSTYYMARFPMPHSYIGIQPARGGERLHHEDQNTGVHHVALWARNRREIDRFHAEFLLREDVTVTEVPAEYPIYAPGYYAVFFVDATGIRWELAHIPRIPSPWAILRSIKAGKALMRQHPEWDGSPMKAMMRRLPSRDDLMRERSGPS
ncbi:VOC family protein [Thiorhodococcus fuscus]|uniref:VOC family protein n=1 Tax=Thiorhodococcus fuscus TaxID=527200 RepID=A0ABW4YC81_9GAMM